MQGPAIDFDPSNLADAREKTIASIHLRRGQAAFRKSLITAYKRTCAVTGCQVLELLEAAHICPYQGAKTNHVQNGLLLRADIHTLFDLGLLGIDSNYCVVVDRKIESNIDYKQLQGKKDQPSSDR